MRILLATDHRYPARRGGSAASRIVDTIAKGLAELGHTVFYQVRGGLAEALPEGVIYVSERRYDVDIFHLQDGVRTDRADTRGKPWVRTIHAPPNPDDDGSELVGDNWIFVSASHARSYGKKRYVLNGIDPAEFIFSETKQDYFLFVVAGLERAELKGLQVVQALVDQLAIELVIAGYSRDKSYERRFAAMCKEKGIRFTGGVHGREKAELIAGARGLLAPSVVAESCPLVIEEALMSGTPVICSNRGACPELVTPDVGFVCATQQDYEEAVARIGEISPGVCRAKAVKEFHYRRMAADYVKEYEKSRS